MSATHLRLVYNERPIDAATRRINAAIDRMMESAREMRVSAASLQASSAALKVQADKLEQKIPLFDAAKASLAVEHRRALEIAADAGMLERDILQRADMSSRRLAA
jgi:hypothetical protein